MMRKESGQAVIVPIPERRSVAIRYAVSVGATVLALAATLPLASLLQRVVFVLFWPAVIGSAWFGGLGPAVLASALSVFAVDYFIVGPGDVALSSPDDLVPFAVFLLASSAVALLTTATRAARRDAAEAASRNAELAHELELQATELEQQLEESQSLSEELEQSSEELADRTAAAERAEHFAKAILDSITHPFVVHDADWRFRFINDAAAEAFRQGPHALKEPPIGQVVWDVYPDIVGTAFENGMRRAVDEKKPVAFEAFYPGRGGWMSLSCFPLEDGGLATQWIDITARKRAEEAEHYLGRASEVLASSLDYRTTLAQLARVMVPNLADWCAIHVVENGEPVPLTVAHVDPAKAARAQEIARRFPHAPDSPTGVPNVVRTGKPELIPDISDATMIARITDAEQLRLTRELGLRSALLVPLRTGGDVVVGALTLVSAESGRRYTERDLPLAMELARRAAIAIENARLHEQAVAARASAERLQRLTAALAEARSETDVARIVVRNLHEGLRPRATTLYRAEPCDDGDYDLVLTDDSGVDATHRARYSHHRLSSDFPIAQMIRGREPVFLDDAEAFAARFPAFAREPGMEALVGIPLVGSSGQPLGAVALGFLEARAFDDETRGFVESIGDQATQAFERVSLLQTEHAAREAAEEANRAKTQFLATMSHELRTPLNAISGYAELLSLGLRGPTTPEQQEDLGRIMRSQRHLLSVINDILNFARLDAGHVEYRVVSVSVTELLGDLESLIRPQLASKQLEFACDASPANVVVRADAEKVRQVLLNLLANAVKFTPPGGRVQVTCDYDDDCVYIRVTDTGIGIPADRRGAIFEPFVQLHRTLAQPAEGTGLGLAISRDLARGMGGELSVESEPGRGSTFTLMLDRVRDVRSDLLFSTEGTGSLPR
jgi:signal transduction histidine kinase/PAS domain-containing protein